ncbi:TetR/AcrR family transcriptional regulator [Streptomyces tubbatahanensis]|uniref:TetR/AcrR family transcriptional regulator n=1 Tax=Streptomyces tubbatahanensis TaxID=2923272 RepID=A0ABY3Y1E7_9ACTN|nr:TetR/AcrR family transcriptional regulator [Streptomyces tubbatahanensis]UNT00420.1 TetR/AcrR family transcriptional regulator [Streptomyces tubbatahanensis]
MTTPPPGLRERKKRATREALREAALRLAVEHGPDRVRVEDIAEAAGVSPRTYNNYFASREQAIVAAVTADRETRIAAAVAARPAGTRLADAVSEAVIEQYTNPGEREREALLPIATGTALRDAFLDAAAEIEPPLTVVVAERLTDAGAQTARVLAASVAAAVRIALEGWLRSSAGAPGASGADGAAGAAGAGGPAESLGAKGLVVPSGSLPDLLRAAMAPLAPAFDAAEGRGRP